MLTKINAKFSINLYPEKKVRSRSPKDPVNIKIKKREKLSL